MANAQNYTVAFIIRTGRMKNNVAPIYARISVDGKRTEFFIKREVHPNLWDQKAGKVKRSAKTAREINQYLEQVRSKLMNHYSEAILEGKVITGKNIKNRFFGIKEESVKTTNDLFEYHNTTCKTKLNPNTYKLYLATQRLFQEFLNQKHKTESIAIQSVNYTLLVDFELYLRKRDGKLAGSKLCNNTAMKHLCRIRKMMNLAERIGWITSTPFKNFRLSYDKKDRGFLSSAQLQSLKEKEFSSQRLQAVKDLFIFSCYTGLAYIDLQNLTHENIIKGIDGQPWLSFFRHKTQTSVKLPLLSAAEKIIASFHDNPTLAGKPWLFPRISNQKMNAYLKEIADLCGIKERLTFHMARHTFATTVTLSNGVPIETVSKILGHSDIKTTQIYAKVIENKVADDMSNLRTRLDNPGNKSPREAQ